MADDTLRPRPIPFSPVQLGWIDEQTIQIATSHSDMAIPTSVQVDPTLRVTPIIGPIAAMKNEHVTDVRLIRTYFVFYGRNAWHSTWIQRYLSNGAICMSIDYAKTVAEKWRRQGSVLQVDELPALLIQTSNRSFLVTEINDKNQSGLLSHCLNTADDLVDWLNLNDRFLPDSVVVLSTAMPATAPQVGGDAKFQQHRAFPRSWAATLGWEKRPFEPASLSAMQACAAKSGRFVAQPFRASHRTAEGI